MSLLDPKKDIEQIKNALKIDFDDDDIEVKRAAIASLSYVKNAIGKKEEFYNQLSESSIEQLNETILMLTEQYYFSRSALNNENVSTFTIGFTSSLLQLKAAYAVFIQKSGDIDE